MKTKEKYWKIWDMTQSDLKYRIMMRQLKKLEGKLERIMQGLAYEDRDVIGDFIALSEDMSSRMLEVACEQMEFNK